MERMIEHIPRATRVRPARLAMLAGACLPLLAGAPLAIGQSEDQLQDELARTRDELRTAEALIGTLREEVARLQAELREALGEELPDAQAEIPADPLACPASMAAELARRYERDLTPLAGSLAPEAFEEAALAWCERTAEEIRGRREWLITIADLAPIEGGRDHTARIRVYDELTLLPLGGYEVAGVPARFVARIKSEPQTELWLLAAEVRADPMFNPARATRGAFDEPTFVGPYIESGFALDWTALTATDLSPTNAPPVVEAPPTPPPPPPGPDR